MMEYPPSMTAVQIWTAPAPTAMYSTASSQVEMPPMPYTGRPSAAAAIWATARSPMGFTAFPEYPP